MTPDTRQNHIRKESFHTPTLAWSMRGTHSIRICNIDMRATFVAHIRMQSGKLRKPP